MDWFEEPNYRRGGWSGVARIELKLPLGGKVGVFLKRQQDHVMRTLRHPFKGMPTFAREFDYIREFQQRDIPTLDVVFFEQWKEKGHQRAILMTEELAAYTPLSAEEYAMNAKILSAEKQKTDLFIKLAELMKSMHKHNFQHNGFYAKHVFARRLTGVGFDLRVIDLEQVKKKWFKKQAICRDLDTLMRRNNGWSDDDKLEFLKIYQDENTLSRRSKKLWAELNRMKK